MSQWFMEEESKMYSNIYNQLQKPTTTRKIALGGYLIIDPKNENKTRLGITDKSKKTKPGSDSRKKSASEAFVNSFGSYPIGYGLGLIILPISMGWLQDDLFVANIFVTLVYATISFVRTYYLRRIFERLGIDDNFIRLFTKLYQKTRKLFNKK